MPHQKDPFRISDLLLKKLNDSLSHSEETELAGWLAQSHENRKLLEQLSTGEIRLRDVHKLAAFDADKAFKKVNSKLAHRSYFPKMAAAAALLLAASALWLYTSPGKTVAPSSQPGVVKSDIPPGGNRALLVLSNGARIDLGDAKTGTIADQAGVAVHKTIGGALAYDSLRPNAAAENTLMAYNTLAVPRGGQFQLTLSDGTKVWLNAASTIKYPVIFNSAQRIVELSGEAYFEIAPNPEKPFKVVTKGQTVEVLGTHFDLESYPDEDIQTTTLLQGSIRVTKGSTYTIVKPGQKVTNRESSARLITTSADIDEAIAWKNGNFIFNDEPVQSIMKKLSRWYDMDVVYAAKVPDQTFWGTYTRSKSLNSLLRILEETHTIHFKIEGRKIIVGS